MMRKFLFPALCLSALVSMNACKKDFNPADGAPPAAQVTPTGDMSLVQVDKPEQFPWSLPISRKRQRS